MQSWKKFSELKIDKLLRIGKNAVIKINNADNTESTINLTELAALDSIGAADLAKIDGITNGTQAAGKAVVADANVNTGVSKITALHIGATGSETQVTATAAELNYNDIAVLGTGAASKTVVLDTGEDYTWPATGILTYGVLKDPAATTLTATVAELNYNDIAALGTGAASKAVVLDSGEDYTWPNTGVLTLGVLATAVEASEHAAGAIGTAVAPATYRWIEHGVIVTQTKFDLTGLTSMNTANDVIGLAAGGIAYIGRNVVATNGVIFKVELSCLETPAGGDNDVNVVANATGTLEYDGAGGTTYLSNSGDLLAGQTVQNLLPALTANDYFYLTAGTGDTAAAYTAGMYVLTTYGHPLLA